MFDEIETRFANAMFEQKLAQSSLYSRDTVLVKKEKNQATFYVGSPNNELLDKPSFPKLATIKPIPKVRKFGEN